MSQKPGLSGRPHLPKGRETMSKRTIYPGAELPLIYGHRGYSAKAPENTLAAFQLLLDHRIPGVELDVQMCASGELVVIHDFELKRLTGAEGRVDEKTYSQLQKLRIGPGINPDFHPEPIPLLKDVFALLGDQVYYDVELKSESLTNEPLAKRAVEMIRQFGLQDRVMISSFNPFTVRQARKAGFKRTALIYSKHKEVHWFLRRGEGRIIAKSSILKPGYEHITPAGFFLDHKLKGFPMVTWTIDNPKEAERLYRAGMEGFIANDPGIIRDTLKSVTI